MVKHALVALLLILGASASKAQDLDEPLLLVASPELQGPYSHTAVLVVPRHPGGTSVRLFGELFVTVQADVGNADQAPGQALAAGREDAGGLAPGAGPGQ
jgi:hypothetical protein